VPYALKNMCAGFLRKRWREALGLGWVRCKATQLHLGVADIYHMYPRGQSKALDEICGDTPRSRNTGLVCKMLRIMPRSAVLYI
jgi:hypothetical protein